MMLTTLCYPIRGGQVLLAMKKRGFGAGKWNGPGGKIKGGELPEDACRRETLEETGITANTLEDRGRIVFLFPHKPEWDNECRIYVARDVYGEPVETEEMRPSWFEINAVPYPEMWDDDPHWLPGILAGGSVNMTFTFDEAGKVIDVKRLDG